MNVAFDIQTVFLINNVKTKYQVTKITRIDLQQSFFYFLPRIIGHVLSYHLYVYFSIAFLILLGRWIR